MFGIGLPEFILIMALALIVVGPDKLPGLAKTVAKQILELKKAASSLKDSLQDELTEEKESLKELTSGFEDVDVSLDHLTNAKSKGEADIYPPQAAENIGESENEPEAAPAVSDLSGDKAEKEAAAPKP